MGYEWGFYLHDERLKNMSVGEAVEERTKVHLATRKTLQEHERRLRAHFLSEEQRLRRKLTLTEKVIYILKL